LRNFLKKKNPPEEIRKHFEDFKKFVEKLSPAVQEAIKNWEEQTKYQQQMDSFVEYLKNWQKHIEWPK